MLVLPGRRASGRHRPPAGRVLTGPGGRCRGDVHAWFLRGVQPSGWAGPGRSLQVLLGRRGRHRMGRGRRRPAPGTPLGRPPQRPPGTRGHPRHSDQPGRRLQRPDRPQRPGPGAGHPRRARRRPPVPGRRGRGRGPRHRHPPGRPHRGPSPPRHLRPEPRTPPPTRLVEVQHRPHPGRRRRRRHHQDGRSHAPRRPPQNPPCGPTDPRSRLDRRRRGTAHRAPRLAPARGEPATPGGCLLVRRQRHQRPCRPGGGRAASGGNRPWWPGAAGGAVRAVGGE